jgi:hypothetical protein
MRHYLYLLLCLPFCAFSATTEPEKPAVGIEKVSPIEDLMREHGVLDRLLLIYPQRRKTHPFMGGM